MKRPLTGEPLPLDLLNTVWIEGGAIRDALDDPAAVSAWLGERALPVHGEAHHLIGPLREAREAIRQALSEPDRPDAFAAINAILARGHLRERLGPHGSEVVQEVEDGHWRIPWSAAHELVELLRVDPTRIRRCEGQGCALWFLDTTRSATRRWCSMDSCGNRAKLRRHRARQGVR